jgi:hypothetical protein
MLEVQVLQRVLVLMLIHKKARNYAGFQPIGF